MIGEYLIEKHIGEGTFGSVKLAIHLSTKQRVAIKLASKEEATKEYNFLKMLRHPNVVQPIDLLNVPANLRTKKNHEQALVLNYVEGGDLLEYVSKNGRLNEKTALKFLGQLVSALSHCHRMRIAHRDIKPENVLVDSKNGNIVLADFGLSTNYHPTKLLKGRVGSLLYCAPELLLNMEYIGPEVDIWSAGVVLYAMISGCIPWEGADQATQLRNAVVGKYYRLPYISKEMGELIHCMLSVNPYQRPTADELCKRLGVYQQPRTIIPNDLVVLEEDGEYSSSSQCGSVCGTDSGEMEEDGETFESPPSSPKQFGLRLVSAKELKSSTLYRLAFVEGEILCQSIERAFFMLNVKFDCTTRKKKWISDGCTKYHCAFDKCSFEVEVCKTSETGSKVILCQNFKGDIQQAKTVMNLVFNKCPFL